VGTITVGTPVAGTLSADDCLHPTAFKPADRWTLIVPDSMYFTIALSNPNTFPDLQITPAPGTVGPGVGGFGGFDEPSGTFKAEITWYLRPGTWYIYSMNVFADEFGPYTLAVDEAVILLCEAGCVRPEPASGGIEPIRGLFSPSVVSPAARRP
jgi:hypothetical protein